MTDRLKPRWYYRWRFTNWLIAEPWRISPPFKFGWRYGVIYRIYREEQRNPRSGKLYMPAHGRLKALWLTIIEPHVHSPGIEITDLNQIPEFASEHEEAEFWDTHELAAELWDQLPEA